VHYTIVELSAELRARQGVRPACFGRRVGWADTCRSHTRTRLLPNAKLRLEWAKCPYGGPQITDKPN
jgi:hypothetical protein